MACGAFLRALLPVLLATASTLACAEPATVERDSPLYSKPDSNAPVVTTLKRGTTGDATTRQGAFVNLKTSSGTGWVPTFNLRYGSAAGSGGSVDTSTVSRFAAPQQPLKVTSTIGVRGIEKEDLQKAQFDPQQIAQLEKYRASDAAAKASATSSGLRPMEINYLDKR